MTSRKLTQLFLSLAALVVLSMTALAGDPGAADPGTLSDQKRGAILYYNLYSSSSTNPAAENSRIAITNTNDADSALVHLFFVDGRTCSVADSFICLTKSQTATILASDVDPDVMGYIVAVAVRKDGSFNEGFEYLIGDEYVKLASGHVANLGAEAITGATAPADIRAKVGDAAAPNPSADMVQTIYFQAPRVLAMDNVPSAKDGNDTLLVVNNIIPNLVTGGGSSDDLRLFGLLFDELENSYSYSFAFRCQFKASLNDSFPRTAPRFTSVVPAGTSGWTKFWSTSNRGLLGAMINKNTSNSATSFNGGHNLHKLTYTGTTAVGPTPQTTVGATSIQIPVFNAMGCGGHSY